MCVWSMIIDHHDNKTQNQENFVNSIEVRKARSNYKVCECDCEYAADIIDVRAHIWRNFSFLYRIWTIYGVLSKFMPFWFQIYVEKNLCGENLCGEKMTNMRSDWLYLEKWRRERWRCLDVTQRSTNRFPYWLLPCLQIELSMAVELIQTNSQIHPLSLF